MRGVAYARKSYFDRAIADFNEAIRLDPTDANPLYNRGQARLLKGDKEGGNADMAAAKRLNPEVGR
jgi:Flp pilus assembly protein TadD